MITNRSLFTIPLTLLLLSSMPMKAAQPTQSDFDAAYIKSLELLDLYRKGDFLIGLSEDPSTVASITQAYELGQQTVTDPLLLAELTANYGGVASTLPEAGQKLKDAIAMVEAYQKQHPDSEALIKPLVSIGHLNYDFAGLAGADKYYRRAFKLADQHWARQKRLADLYLEAGVRLSFHSHATAKDYMKEALQIYSSLSDVEGMAATNMHLGRFWIRRIKYLMAEEYLKAGLAILGDNPTSTTTFIGLHTQLVKLYALSFKPELARQHSQIIGATYAGKTSDELTILYVAPPHYPPNASRLRESGHVTLNFTVNEFGEVVNPVVAERVGHHEFENSALSAIQFARYAPRFENGQAVATPDVKFTYRFGMIEQP
jgi:TonB family protein